MELAHNLDDIDSETLRLALRYALNGEAILFLGAGASKDATRRDGTALPVGQELADALAMSVALPKGYQLDSIAEHFVTMKSEYSLITKLKEELAVDKLGPGLLALASLPWLRIWTTNYDNAFELALTAHHRSHHSLTASDDIANAQGSRCIVIHINGSLSTLTHSITPDFVLTSTGYATQKFVDSEWSALFKNDIRRAKAVIFVGYSLADIDIARIIFNPSLLKKKLAFIDRTGIDPVLKTKLQRFGTVYPVGIESVAGILDDERQSWEKPEYAEQYLSFSLVEAQTNASAPTDDDFYNLLLKGTADDAFLSYQAENPESPVYVLNRDCEQECIEHTGQKSAVVLITSSFANGKSLTIRSICVQLASRGVDVFELSLSTREVSDEIAKLCRRDRDFVLVVENYSRNLEAIEDFCRLSRPSCALITSERSHVNELRFHALKNATRNRTIKGFDLDAISREEATKLSNIFSFRGVWGERAGLTPTQKIAYIRHDCEGQLNALLIEVVKSPQIRDRLNAIVAHFQATNVGFRLLTVLCLLQTIGELPRIAVAADLLGLTADQYRTLIADESVREILEVRSGIANFRSPVIGSAVLSGYTTAAAVTTVVAECIKRGEQDKRADPYLGSVSKELTRFANLERILPEKGRREALQNLYEDIKQVRSIRENPHFWLQYAMARLALGDLPIARRYFDQSYSYAKALSHFDTFQIDNHYCRLLLMEAENATDADNAYNLVSESLAILKKQVLRENRHYPYRSAWNLDGVSKRHAQTWSVDQRGSVVAAAKYLIDAANHLDVQVARSVAVVGGLQRLQSVIERLSEPPRVS